MLPALALARSPQPRLHCSMCGKTELEVRYLMAGAAGGHLCDACAIAAAKIVVVQRLRDVVRPTNRR